MAAPIVRSSTTVAGGASPIVRAPTTVASGVSPIVRATPVAGGGSPVPAGQAQAIIAQVEANWKKKRSWFDRLMSGTGRGVINIATGLPGGIYQTGKLVGRGVAGEAVGLYATTPLIGSSLPGHDWAKRFSGRTGNELKQAGGAIVDDFKRRYGPLASGDFDTFRDQFLDDPVPYALDLAGGWGAVGKGVGAAARGARAVGIGKDGGVAERLAARAADSPYMKRPDDEIVVRLPGENTTEGRVVTRDRGLMSRNPVTRELIQRPLMPARSAASGWVRGTADQLAGDKASGARRRVFGPLGNEAAADRITRRQLQDKVFKWSDAADRDFHNAVAAFNVVRRRLDSAFGDRLRRMNTGDAVNTRAERDAMMLHAVGLLDVPGLTGRESLDLLTSRLEAGVARSAKEGHRVKLPQRQVERFKLIPDELLEYDSLPAHVKDAVDVARATVAESQARLVQAGFMSQQVEAEVRGRAARELYGGEENIAGMADDEGLRSPAAEDRYRQLGEQIAGLEAEVARLKQPAPRREKLRTLQAARRNLKQAQKYSRTRQAASRRHLALAEQKMRELEGTQHARLPVPAGDAQVALDGGRAAGFARDLEWARSRLARAESVVTPVIHRDAAGMTPVAREKVQVGHKRKKKIRYKPAYHYYGHVEDGIRRRAAEAPRDTRPLEDILYEEVMLDQTPGISDVAFRAKEKRLRESVRSDMIAEDFAGAADIAVKHGAMTSHRRPLLPDDPVVRREIEVALNKWGAEEQRRVTAARAELRGQRKLSPAQVRVAVQKELRSASRSKPEVAGARVAALVCHSIPMIDMLREGAAQRLAQARVADGVNSTAGTRAALRRSEREADLLDGAWRAAVQRRLRDAEPEVRAQAIAQGLIDESAPSENPRVLAALLDEMDAASRDVADLEVQLGITHDPDPDALFGDEPLSAGGEVEARSAREIRDENFTGFTGPAEPAAADKQQRALHRALMKDDGPAKLIEQAIRDERLERDAIRGGYQPRDITERVERLHAHIADAEAELAVARATEVGTRKQIQAAEWRLARIKELRQTVKSPRQTKARIAVLERKMRGELSDAEAAKVMDELVDLRSILSDQRSSPVPPEYADVVPSIREFVKSVRDDEPLVATISPEVDALPGVQAAAAVTGEAAAGFRAALAAGENVMAAESALRQAYYLEREARIAGARSVHGVEWRENPSAQHLPAVPLHQFTDRPASMSQPLTGRVVAQKAKQGAGVQRRTGNVDAANEGHVLEQAHRAARMGVHPFMVQDIVESFAVRMNGGRGRVATGNRVLQLLKADPDRYVAISKASLDQTYRRLDELQDGHWLDESVVKKALPSDGLGDVVRRDGDRLAFQAGVDPKDVILLPRSVANEWRDALAPTAGPVFMRKYDSALSAWKAGVLAFHPRWYVYNMTGNLLQYGIMSLGDVRSIIDVARNREKIRKSLGDAGQSVHNASLARDAGQTDLNLESGVLARVAHAGFRINDGMEGFLRDAAMWSATKKEVRLAGKSGRRSSVDDVLDAIDGIDPESPVLREAARTATLFMGDYRKFSPFERAVMRRVFPFYSWLRVISRVALALPVKYPMRTWLMQMIADVGYNALPDEERALEMLRPVYDRGGIPLPGGLSLRTTSANPFGTIAGLAEGFGLGPTGFVGELGQSVTPAVSPLIAAWTGTSLLGGRDFSAPEGHKGSVNVFGGELWTNPVTGVPERAEKPRPSIFEGYAQATLPFYSTVVRKAASWGERPYDTASTPQVLLNRVFGVGDSSQIFKEPSKYPAISTPIGPAGLGTVALSELGVPVTRRNNDAYLALIQSYYDKIVKGRESQERKKAGG